MRHIGRISADIAWYLMYSSLVCMFSKRSQDTKVWLQRSGQEPWVFGPLVVEEHLFPNPFMPSFLCPPKDRWLFEAIAECDSARAWWRHSMMRLAGFREGGWDVREGEGGEEWVARRPNHHKHHKITHMFPFFSWLWFASTFVMWSIANCCTKKHTKNFENAVVFTLP